MITSKSPRRVLLTAYRLARDTLPMYSSKFSRHDITLPQLFACLVLKEFEKDYRGAEQLLLDCPRWGREIGMPHPPDHATLKRAANRLLRLPRARRLLDELLALARACKVLDTHVALAAMDASGVEARHVSAYFVRRSRGEARKLRKSRGVSAKYRLFPKLALVVDTKTHLALSFVAGLTGPSPDHPHFERALFDAWRRLPGRMRKLAADATRLSSSKSGYDSEANHELARRDLSVATLIPALIGRPTRNAPSTRWRRHMSRLLRTKRGRRESGYTQRWQVETVNSMMKRNQGSALRARGHRARNRELALRVLTHNLAVLRPRVATEQLIPFSGFPARNVIRPGGGVAGRQRPSRQACSPRRGVAVGIAGAAPRQTAAGRSAPEAGGVAGAPTWRMARYRQHLSGQSGLGRPASQQPPRPPRRCDGLAIVTAAARAAAKNAK